MRQRQAETETGMLTRIARKALAALGLAAAILCLTIAVSREEARGQQTQDQPKADTEPKPTTKSDTKTTPSDSGKSKTKTTKPHQRGRIRRQHPQGVPIRKDQPRPNAEDPLAVAQPAAPAQAQGKATAAGKYHYTLKIRSFDEGTQFAASYYPPNPPGSSAPAILLVHEFGRSRKDFDDSIGDLRGEGLAEHLQGLGFAVLSIDLRGQGQNVRRALNANDREKMVQDLQAAYQFLVDRHNRGELNLSKLAVLGAGEGANLVAAWAFQPGAAMTIDERPSDINAMILVSPLATGHGYRLDQLLDSLATRFPTLILAGEKDKASNDAAKASERALARSRLNKVEYFPSALRAYTLLRLEPKVTGSIVRFLEGTVKSRAAEYEPRYNLNPIAFFDIQTQKNGAKSSAEEKSRTRGQTKAVEKAKAQPKEPEKAQPKEPEKAQPKEPEKAKAGN